MPFCCGSARGLAARPSDRFRLGLVSNRFLGSQPQSKALANGNRKTNCSDSDSAAAGKVL